MDNDHKLIAEHDGFGTVVSRTFDGSDSVQMTVIDKLIYKSKLNGYYSTGYLHLHPDVHLDQLNEATFLINNRIELSFQSDKYNPSIIEVDSYSYAKGYNTLLEAKVISYSVFEQTIIQIREAS